MSGQEPSQEPADAAAEVTRLLSLAREGRATDELLALVYEELRALASRAMAREPAGHTLQPTALVHEAWLRLAGVPEGAWEDRAHFFRTAARAMRRVLVDRARRVAQPKHGGGVERVTLDRTPVAGGPEGGSSEVDVLALGEALDGLEAIDPRLAEIVSLRFFAGFDVEETARALGVSTRTVKREWSVAKAWLHERLDGGDAA
jgi:RNA polymerase sigma factor (TIGR02999 family)